MYGGSVKLPHPLLPMQAQQQSLQAVEQGADPATIPSSLSTSDALVVLRRAIAQNLAATLAVVSAGATPFSRRISNLVHMLQVRACESSSSMARTRFAVFSMSFFMRWNMEGRRMDGWADRRMMVMGKGVGEGDSHDDNIDGHHECKHTGNYAEHRGKKLDPFSTERGHMLSTKVCHALMSASASGGVPCDRES
eukprot:1139655-Pelagomonas_calceolata.AAC.3